ncbi:hypothetical protein H0H92_009323 [Tricholoma furcatifolium]|nr:hypothetical protein H0H92_009323 [Tricholoma furcatifolium]
MESPRTRIKRKPPPLVDAALAADLRYPSPDPSDPFAPLWALRTRGSCGSLRHASNLRADAPQESPLRTESIHSSAVTDESPSKWSSGLFKRTNRMQASPSASSSLVHVSMPTTNCCIAGADDAHSLLQPAPTEWLFPTPSQLAYAASLPVVAPSGLRVPFASLFETHPTVIIFLRHFWCPLCQDYSASIASTLPSNTAAPSPRIILIGNGSPSYITKYLALFGLNRHSSIEMYTDPTLAVYAALGMKRSSSPPSSTPPSTKSTPQTKLPSHSAENAISPDAKKSYIRHGSVSGVALVVLRGLKAGLPIWEPGGNIHQLGGEFVLGPG